MLDDFPEQSRDVFRIESGVACLSLDVGEDLVLADLVLADLVAIRCVLFGFRHQCDQLVTGRQRVDDALIDFVEPFPDFLQ